LKNDPSVGPGETKRNPRKRAPSWSQAAPTASVTPAPMACGKWLLRLRIVQNSSVLGLWCP